MKDMTAPIPQTVFAYGHPLETDRHSFGWLEDSAAIKSDVDPRYQRSDEPADERWVGENPIAHGPAGKRGLIC